MAKTVNEVLAEITPAEKDGKKSLGRFSKKNFNALMRAMANDPEFTVKVANVKKGELESLEDVMVSKNFRKCIQKILEEAGVDKSESVKVMGDEFEFPSLDGMYEFFAAALYTYMEAGNQFDLMPTEDFKGSLYLKDVEASVTEKEAKLPQTGESLGIFRTEKKAHKVLAAKSSCPSWLKNRKKVD